MVTPAISLPKGGGAMRGMGEKFATNPVTGTGSLAVPLPLSPGRSGVSPSLTLGYDSGAANGPFGLGWHLDLPSITRKTDKGLPAYRDSRPRSETLDSDLSDPSDLSDLSGLSGLSGLGTAEDTFLLSGAEDLVPVLTGHDGHWTPVRERREDGGREFVVDHYRPRVEGLFARIERWRDPRTRETHWRSISKDNLTTVYGRDAGSRIADPRDPALIFTWLICETRDDLGNVVRYDYKAEDCAGVDLAASHERNRPPESRCVQRYLKRIRYGNTVSLLAGGPSGWHFEVVFDYGEHHPEAPTPVEENPWTARLDPFSTRRPGFEVRTYRLCRRILMFHHFPDRPEVGADCLVRAVELTYRGDPARGERVVSFIASVTQRGFRRRPDGGYVVRSLPPLELRYHEAKIETQVHTVDPANLPAGVDGTAYRWVDLDGDGIPGVLTEQAGTWFYERNLGGGRFGPARAIRIPTTAALNRGRQELLDLAGDGSVDLVDFSPPMPGFAERTPEDGWTPFRAFGSLPGIAWDDPDLRFVDLNGDGRADVLIAGEQAFTWYPARGEDGFGGPGRTFWPDDEERGPRVVFADPALSIHLADMSGDGLSDLVRVRNGEVCYWPNLGYGRFGPKVAMDGAPWLDEEDQFDPGRIRLADVDGSGTADLIYLHSRGARLYANRSGNSWAPPHELGLSFPRADSAARVGTVDLLGTGTVCLVWSSALPTESGRQLRYLDLMGGRKPHLLVSVRNNLGAETHVRYTSSTRFAVADREAGRPWVTSLPFPVQVVERLTTVDRIGRNRFTTRYAYHHGYFDGVEREFRGFGMVEQWDTEQFATLGARSPDDIDAVNLDENVSVPPVLTRTWFHNGAFTGSREISRQFAREYFADERLCAGPGLPTPGLSDSVLPDAVRSPGRAPSPWRLSADETRQAYRALKGMPLRQEIYGIDGGPTERRPYLITEHNYTVRLLQPAVQPSPDAEGMRHAVLLVTPRETLTAHYERQAEPRISHELMLDVDDYGNVLRSAAVAYGRPGADAELDETDRQEQQRRHLTLTHHRYTNSVESPDAHRTPVGFETRMYEVAGVAPAGRIFGFGELRKVLGTVHVELSYEDWEMHPSRPVRRLVERTRSLFRKDDLSSPLPLGTIESRALPHESYRQVFTPSLVTALYGDRVDGATLTEAGYLESDGAWWISSGRTFYAPEGTDEREFATRHFFLPRRFRDPFGAVTQVSYDDYDLLVVATRDPLGNLVTVGERDADDRLVSNDNDYRVLKPRLATDVNRNRTEVSFDALGRVAGTAMMGKREESLGDTLAGFDPDPEPERVAAYFAGPLAQGRSLLGQASSRLVYDDLAYWHARNPGAAATVARETHVSDLMPGATTRTQHHLSYSDGFGREIQTKALAEPGPLEPGGVAVPRRWTGSGWTIFNNKGNPVRSYEPFFSATHRFEFARSTGVSSVLFYDALGRVVATLHPNGCYAKIVFDPWRQSTWDVNDTVLLDPREDPDIGGHVRRYLAATEWTTWYTARIGGELGKAEQHAAEQTAVHAGTPVRAWFDGLGRTFLSVAHNRFVRDGAEVDEWYPNRTRRDIEGNEREIRDALGRAVMRYAYDMLGHRVDRAGMDSAGGTQLPDAAGNVRYSWNARGFRFRTDYDLLRRPVSSTVEGPGLDGALLYQRTEYGEERPGADGKNLRGRLYRQFDGAGVNTHHRYDFKGNLVHSGRQLAREYRDVLDWSEPVALEGRVYESRTGYDALNRPVSLTTPDGSTVHPAYNEAGLLARLDAELRGAGAVTEFVTGLDYNPRGQRTAIEYGNGARTRYTYDPSTFRLTAVLTTVLTKGLTKGRAPENAVQDAILQDLGYTYDPAGHITGLRDDAQETVFFDNQVVEPDARYVYDAVYRLIEAGGREHPGQGHPPDAADALRTGLPQPGDGTAMARYVERYAYDAAGNIVRTAHRGRKSGWTRHYRYTEPSLLEPGVSGDRLSATTTADQVSTAERFRYDRNGNITAMPGLPVLRWDPEERLQATSRQSAAHKTSETTYYVYDGTGQRVRKVTEHASRRKSERIYLGPFEIHREFAAGERVTRERETLHVLDDKQRIALVETRTIGTDPGPEQLVRNQFTNQLSSAVLELDDIGRVISYEEYHPFGSTSYQAVRAGVETPKRYRFTGKERESETGLYYHGARYYAPWLGRWTAPDPAGLVDGPNLYAYVRNDPVNHSDPTGHLSLGQWVGIAAAVVVGTVVTVATAGVAGPLVGTATAAVIGGIVGGAVGSGVGEALEAHIDHRESHVLRAAVIGGVIGGAFAGAGLGVSAALRTAAGSALASKVAGSAVGAVARRIAQSAIGRGLSRAVSAVREPSERLGQRLSERLGAGPGAEMAEAAAGRASATTMNVQGAQGVTRTVTSAAEGQTFTHSVGWRGGGAFGPGVTGAQVEAQSALRVTPGGASGQWGEGAYAFEGTVGAPGPRGSSFQFKVPPQTAVETIQPPGGGRPIIRLVPPPGQTRLPIRITGTDFTPETLAEGRDFARRFGLTLEAPARFGYPGVSPDVTGLTGGAAAGNERIFISPALRQDDTTTPTPSVGVRF
jgi:RHS repeat-associated protein